MQFLGLGDANQLQRSYQISTLLPCGTEKWVMLEPGHSELNTVTRLLGLGGTKYG